MDDFRLHIEVITLASRGSSSQDIFLNHGMAMELNCEECGAVIASDTCEQCHKPAPLWAKFCPHCGRDLTQKRAENAKNKNVRRLCSDESCIGIIGPDGVCVECGKRP